MPKFTARSAGVAAVALAFVFVAGSASGAHAKRRSARTWPCVRWWPPPPSSAVQRSDSSSRLPTRGPEQLSDRRSVHSLRETRAEVEAIFCFEAANSIPPLAPGAMARKTGTAMVPRSAGTGQWSLIVCAAAERDANSRNNCRRSSRRTTVSKHPDASNTGPTGSLTESTGNITVTASGRVIQNRKINGCITVNAANVTVRNVEVHCNDDTGISLNGTGLLVEDALVECGHRAGLTGVGGSGFTVRRTEIFGCENNVWANRNIVIEDNYIHDPIPCCGPGDPHTDSVPAPRTAGRTSRSAITASMAVTSVRATSATRRSLWETPQGF